MRRSPHYALALAALGLWGCPGHEARVETALAALDAGQNDAAIASLDEELGVASPNELPKLSGDAALLLLDRASLQQAAQRFDLSARDFGAADKGIEVLDLSKNASQDLGRYLFSDDVGPYRSPAFEKLLINSLNMVNYLARGDLDGARVEARRFTVMQKYLKDSGSSAAVAGFGSWLAGFVFEKSGNQPEADRYYGETAIAHPTAAPDTEQGELVVVIGYGRVPPKLPERIPIGLALTLVAVNMSPADSRLAADLAAKGLVTWVNFPRLGRARGTYESPRLAIDGRPADFAAVVDVESEVRAEWDKNEGTVILAAVTRTITRLVAGTAVQAGANALSGDKSGIFGLFAGLATSAALTAADTPDTRSWVTLPAGVAVARLSLPPGSHRVHLEARGQARDATVEARPGSWTLVSLDALR